MSLRFLTGLLTVVSLLPGLVTAQPNLSRFSFRRGLMGTQFNVIFYAPDSLTAQRANASVNARMDSLNQIMSDYLDGSEINELSKTAGSGKWVPVSVDLFAVLKKAKMIASRSNGCFDPTLGPLTLLWRRAVRRKEFPTDTERHRARRAVGYRLMDLDSTTRSVRLRRTGMRLDVGGIGQGYAIDEAIKRLSNFGIKSALIDIGGDILVSDPPPGSQGWRVSIGSGTRDDADTTTIFLKNAAVTTSGDTYRFLEYKGQRYSHIMDPRSGLGLQHFVRTTVLAPDGYRADALTKVFSVAGLRKSRRLVKRFPGVKLLILENKRGQLHRWQSAPFS
ncbi:FAD:protein FMN transferase [Spirosoma radiotolerans]|uniref:FAD:protein FMN transferase n=1 Tax=Spirosoma radiotolerans TaxID=1379870 RepID=A0A0E4A0N4_9BACT|nr:FAD:protein FMN transferase [Spirosoma radiotolerans]AKD58237.1 thiamine biosynthesis protein ApbE [Spirosoma radiotolerans]